MQPLRSVRLAAEVAASTPAPRDLLLDFSNSLINDANQRADEAFAKMNAGTR